MVKIKRQTGDMAFSDVELAPQAIRKTSAKDVTKTPQGDGTYTRRFADIRADSRVSNLVEGTYKVAWKTPLARVTPDLLLYGDQRVVVQGGGDWALFSDSGTALADGRYGPSDVSLDLRAHLIVFVNRLSFVQTHQLSDGKFSFRFNLTYTDLFARPLVARIGKRIYSVGVEAEAFPHRPSPPDRALIEFKEIGTPLEIRNGDLISIPHELRIEIASAKVRSVADDNTIVFSTPGCLYLADLDLNITKAFTGDFEVEAMSRDEYHRTYAVVTTPKGRAIHVITDDGELQLDIPVPADYGPPIGPPAIGYDHAIYYAGASVVAAFSSAGQPLWYRKAACSGIGVTPSGEVVGSAGNMLLRWNRIGDQQLIEFFRGSEKLATAPVVTAEGAVLVATNRNVLCLRAS